MAIMAMLALGGCGASVSIGSDDTLDSGKAESALEKGIQAQNPGLKVQSVTCPDDIKAEKGKTAECTVKIQGGREQTVHLKMTDDDGNFDYNVG